jgi:hypothetical protein
MYNYLISSELNAVTAHALLIGRQDEKTNLQGAVNIFVEHIEDAAKKVGGFWLPIVLSTKLDSATNIQKMVLKNIPKESAITAKTEFDKFRTKKTNVFLVMWFADRGDPNSLELMKLH